MLRAAAGRHRRRRHRLVGQDVDEGPAGPAAGAARADGRAARARSTTSSATRTPCCGPTTETRFLVLENSARGIGHIRYLTEIAPPRIGVVLNVGSAHLGEFGCREAIAQAKGELVEALPAATGVAVLNADDPLVAAMAARTAARVVTVGRGRRRADVRAERRRARRAGPGRVHAARRGADARRCSCSSSGAHHVGNALAAAAVALECGLALPDVAAALAAATAARRWRMEVTERADGVLDHQRRLQRQPGVDARGAGRPGRRRRPPRRGARTFAVLGPMAELGRRRARPSTTRSAGWPSGWAYHELVAVGEQARPIAHGAALEGSWDGESSWVPDVDAAIALLRGELRRGDVVLVKASRSARLERVALAHRRRCVAGPRRERRARAEATRREDDPGRRARRAARSILCTPLVVVFFRRRGFGQEIRIDGPQTHLVKRGTPDDGRRRDHRLDRRRLRRRPPRHRVHGGGGPTASGLLRCS